MKKLILKGSVAVVAFIIGLFAALLPLGRFVASVTIPTTNDIQVDDSRPDFKVQNDVPGIQKSDLFVFVGEKLELIEFVPPEGEIWFDQAFDAKYRVVESIFGEFEGNIIEFRAFDHYGYPPFAKHKYALLFVSKHIGKHKQQLIHEKYQYYDVYKTSDGRWASCGDPYRGMDFYRKRFEPKLLTFAEPVVFDLKMFDSDEIAELFPSEYFEIAGSVATCRKGAYVEELFEIKRAGVLKARGVGQS